MSTELERLRAAYFALCAHVRNAHGIIARGNASQVEAHHQAAHRREGTPWHDAWRDAYQLPPRDKQADTP